MRGRAQHGGQALEAALRARREHRVRALRRRAAHAAHAHAHAQWTIRSRAMPTVLSKSTNIQKKLHKNNNTESSFKLVQDVHS